MHRRLMAIRSRRVLATLLALLVGLGLALATRAEDPPRIEDPSFLDQQYMAQQRALLEDLSRRHFGDGFNGATDHDLELLQRLLDERLVRNDQTRELQAMGVILGDLLAEALDMHWVVYEDKLGRSRALRYRQTENYLFPMTMISRRREVDNETPVAAIYRKAYDIIDPLRQELPFQ
jgi:hypothetical protein